MLLYASNCLALLNHFLLLLLFTFHFLCIYALFTCLCWWACMCECSFSIKVFLEICMHSLLALVSQTRVLLLMLLSLLSSWVVSSRNFLIKFNFACKFPFRFIHKKLVHEECFHNSFIYQLKQVLTLEAMYNVLVLSKVTKVAKVQKQIVKWEKLCSNMSDEQRGFLWLNHFYFKPLFERCYGLFEFIHSWTVDPTFHSLWYYSSKVVKNLRLFLKVLYIICRKPVKIITFYPQNTLVSD